MEDVSRVSTIPSFHNPSFVARDEEIREMHAYLRPREPTDDDIGPRCVILHGLGGQGKTQVALQYSWTHKEEYDAIFFIKSETSEQLAASYLEMAMKLQQANQLIHPPSPGKAPWEIDRALEWLEGTSKRWLLIFDNVEDPGLLRRYLRDFNTGSVIVTTQQKLTRITRRPSQDTKNEGEVRNIREICKWVGGLPLAIVTVAGYMNRSEASAADIWGGLTRSLEIRASSSQQEVNYYEKTLKTVFDLALKGISSNSQHLLNIVVFLSPDCIPEAMLRAKHGLASLNFLEDNDEFLAIRHDLLSRQLIKRPRRGQDDYTIEVHRSLQRDLLLKMATDADSTLRLQIFSEVSHILATVLPKASRLQQNEKELWPVFYAYVPQVIALLQNSQWQNPPLELDYAFAEMLSNIGTFLWHTGYIKECDYSMSTALRILEAQLSEVKERLEWRMLVSDVYTVVGIISDYIGVSRRHESLAHRQKLLALRESEFAEVRVARTADVNDEIRLGNAKGDLACAYLQRGDFTKTRTLMEGLLVDYQRWGREAEYPYEYSKYYHHIGYVLMMEGNPIEVVRFSEKAMELDRLHAGGVDATVLVDLYDTASLKFNAGRVEEALNDHLDVLEQRKKLCGPSSMWTLMSLEAVGIIEYLMGKHANAEIHFKTCLDSQFQSIWTAEGIARARYWHSRALGALCRDEEARTEYKAAMAVRNYLVATYPELFLDITGEEKDDAPCLITCSQFGLSRRRGRCRKAGETHALLSDNGHLEAGLARKSI